MPYPLLPIDRIIDNLPAVECTSNCRGGREFQDGREVHVHPYYRMGFPVGCAIGPARKSMTVCTVRPAFSRVPLYWHVSARAC